MKSISKAIERYYLDQNRWPSEESGGAFILPERDYDCGFVSDAQRQRSQNLFDTLASYIPIPPVVKPGQCFLYVYEAVTNAGGYIGFNIAQANFTYDDCQPPAIIWPPSSPDSFCLIWTNENLDAFPNQSSP